jgi:hypothetical protein
MRANFWDGTLATHPRLSGILLRQEATMSIVMVTRPVSADSVRMILPHEHLLIDLTNQYDSRRAYHQKKR